MTTKALHVRTRTLTDAMSCSIAVQPPTIAIEQLIASVRVHELLDRCTTADYSVVPADRDARTLQPKKIDLDGPDLELAFLDTGQARGLPIYTRLQPHPARVPWVAGTPIIRKDQLTE